MVIEEASRDGLMMCLGARGVLRKARVVNRASNLPNLFCSMIICDCWNGVKRGVEWAE